MTDIKSDIQVGPRPPTGIKKRPKWLMDGTIIEWREEHGKCILYFIEVSRFFIIEWIIPSRWRRASHGPAITFYNFG